MTSSSPFSITGQVYNQLWVHFGLNFKIAKSSFFKERKILCVLQALEQLGGGGRCSQDNRKWDKVSQKEVYNFWLAALGTWCHMSRQEAAEPVTSVSVRMSSQAPVGAPKWSSSSSIPHKTHFSKAGELEMSSHPPRQLHQGSCPCLIKSMQTWLSTSINCLGRAFHAGGKAPRA